MSNVSDYYRHTQDTTDGYTDEQLSRANALLEAWISSRGLDCDPSSPDADECKRLAEQSLQMVE